MVFEFAMQSQHLEGWSLCYNGLNLGLVMPPNNRDKCQIDGQQASQNWCQTINFKRHVIDELVSSPEWPVS